MASLDVQGIEVLIGEAMDVLTPVQPESPQEITTAIGKLQAVLDLIGAAKDSLVAETLAAEALTTEAPSAPVPPTEPDYTRTGTNPRAALIKDRTDF